MMDKKPKRRTKAMRKRRMHILLSVVLVMLLAVSGVAAGSFLKAKAEVGDTPSTGKVLQDNGDGTYKLALSVTGEAEKVVQKTNVTVILDISGSMNYPSENVSTTGRYGYNTSNGSYRNLYVRNNNGTYTQIANNTTSGTVYYNNGGNNYVEYSGPRYTSNSQNVAHRIDAAKTAVNNLAASLLSHNGQDGYPADTFELSLVTFSTHATVSQSPTTNLTQFRNTVNGLTATGGTNWEAALQTANGVNYNDTDQTFVIFVSDGNPTFRQTRGNYDPLDNAYYNSEGVYGNGSDSQPVNGMAPATTIGRCYDHAVDDATTLATRIGASNFFTVGAYGDVSRMQSLTQAAGAPAANYYSAADTSALEAALNAILEQIEMAGFAAVELADPTTSQVQISGQPNVELLDIDTTSFKYYRSGGENSDGTVKYDPTANTITPAGGTAQNIGVEWTSTDTPAPPAASVNATTGMVDWDLSSIGVLENGVTYTVTFDVYPSQTTYDYIADLKNGVITYNSLPAEIREYIIDNGNGNYTLKTNKNYPIVYWDDTRDEWGRQSATIENPQPVATTAEPMTVQKIWIGTYGNEQEQPLEMQIKRDNVLMEETIHLDTANHYQNSMYIATGLLRVDKTAGTVQVLDTGHDYELVEPTNLSYHWELQADIMHPMLINGTLTMLHEVEDGSITMPEGKQYLSQGGKEYYQFGDKIYVVEGEGAVLTATNTRRSNLNLLKTVDGSDAPADQWFTFTLTLTDPIDHAMSFSVYGDGGYRTMDEGVVLTTGLSVNAQDSRYYDVPSGTTITVRLKNGWNLRFPNVLTGTEYVITETELPDNFAFDDAELTATDITSGSDAGSTEWEVDKDAKKISGTVDVGNANITAEFTNIYELINVNVTKVWVDEGNQDGIRPDAAAFEQYLVLKANGTDVTETYADNLTITDNEDNTYSVVWTGVPRYANNQEIVYTIEETEIQGYTTTGSPAQDGGTITNTHTPEVISITAKKVWSEPEGLTANRPASIQVQLKADGTASGAAQTLNSGNSWTYTWQDLPKYAEGEPIEYTVDETAVPENYTEEPVTSEVVDGVTVFTITNVLKTGELDIKKTVVNNANDEDETAFEFTVTFDPAVSGSFPYTIGETTGTISSGGKLTLKNGETAKITGIPVGVTYTVTEKAVDGYSTTKTGDTGTITVDTVQTAAFTNTYSASGNATLAVTKKISGAEWPSGQTLTLTLTGSGDAPMPTTTTATLSAEGSVSFGPIAFDQDDAGETYTYTITESSLGAGWTGDPASITATIEVTDNGDGTLDADVSYSPEDATFTNTYEASGSATLTATKKISGAEWPEGKTLTLTLTGSNGAPMPETTTATLTEPGSVSFGPIAYDQDDAGETYTYTITEDGFGTGWTGTPASITATVEVIDNGDGTLTPAISYDPVDKTFTNTYEAKGEATIEVTKEIEGAAWPEGKTLTITLTGSGDAPMPATTTATLTAAGDASFGPIAFDQDDAGKTYTYTITESSFGDGWTGSPAQITAKVVVTDKGDGTLATEVAYTPENATFTNTYEATGSATLSAIKKISGAEWPEGETLTFTVAGSDGAPMPEKTEVTLNEAGTADFGKIAFTEADAGKTYTYTITEDGFGEGWTGAPEKITATIKVTDNGDGTLSAAVTYDPGDKTITNTYVAEGSAVIEVYKELKGADWPANKTLTFTLSGSNGAPMPQATTKDVTAAGKVSFDAIKYTEADAGKTYTYTITEGSFGDGWTGTPTEITATVVVTDKGDGTLDTKVTYSPEAATFTNTYELKPVTIDPPVQKVIEGNSALYNNGAFTFTIEDASGEGVTAPMPARTTITNSADYELSGKTGFYEFGTITFTEPGTYAYKVTETGYVAGVTNDSEKTLTFTVTDNGDGTMSVDPPTDEAVFVFTNVYKTGELDITKTVVNTSNTVKFTFTVTFTDQEGKDVAGEFPYTIGSTSGTIKSGGTLQLAGGETAKITGIPDGVSYKVTETAVSGYTTVPSNDTGTIDAADVPQVATFVNTYEAEGEASITVTKAITGAAWPSGKTLTLTLAGTGEAPMPATTTAQLTAAGTATFGPIEYDESDAGATYTYTITEDGFGAGWTGSPESITATVEVVDNGDGTLSPKVSYSPTDATITNTYKATGSATLTVSKELEGAGWPEGKTLTITLNGENAPMPETTTASLTSAGSVSFGPIAYTEKDAGQTYTYTIAETSFGAGWTGSGDITATVKVTDNGDGTLATEVSYTNNAKFINTYKAEGEAVLTVTKALEGAGWPEGKTLTFTLAGSGDAPMPDTTTKTLSAEGDVSFDAIALDETDIGKTYTYTISENGFGAGWTGSPESITATVEVKDNGDGTLTAAITYDPEDATITNTYEAEGEATITVSKKLEGAGWPEGKTLTFTLTGSGDAPMPEGTTATLTAEGSVMFGPIAFTEADIDKTYTYTVSEDGFGSDWTSSGDVTATITVKDNGDGTLTAEVTYSPEDATIVNTFVPPPDVKTGDTFRALPLVIALGAGGLGAAGFGTWIGVRKKRARKENM